MKKLVCLAIALVMVLGLAACASAEFKFERKIDLVCPWGVGGGADSTLRPMATLLQDILGVPVEVVNVEGGSGVNGVEYTYKQPADGYTFMLGTQSLYIQDMLGNTSMDFKTEFECEDVLVHSINAIVASKLSLEKFGVSNWAYDEDGMPSFKLENLTKANRIAHQNAHDAMSDVYATIEMAKLIKQKQPKLFQFFFENRGKKALEAMIDTGEMTPLVHVSGMLGNYRGNTAWVVPLAWHPTNQNAVIVCDLAGNTEGLLHEPAAVLRERLYTKKEELEAKGLHAVPLKLVHINKCPILAPAKTLLPENAVRLGIDRPFCLANLKQLKAHKALLREKVIEIFSEERTFEKSDNVETTLYDGFFSPADKNNMAILRSLKPEELAHHGLKFADPRIEALLFHYRARHYPETLSRAEQVRWQKYCYQQIEQKGEAFEQSMEELGLRHQQEPEKLALLTELARYAEQLSQPLSFNTPSQTTHDGLLDSVNLIAKADQDKKAKFKALGALLNSSECK